MNARQKEICTFTDLIFCNNMIIISTYATASVHKVLTFNHFLECKNAAANQKTQVQIHKHISFNSKWKRQVFIEHYILVADWTWCMIINKEKEKKSRFQSVIRLAY